jgi:signal transduction histidine kinase
LIPWRAFATRHPRLVDGAVALAVQLVSLPATVRMTDGRPWVWVFDAALVVPLVWRRRAPLIVFAVLAAVGLVQWFAGVRLGADVALLVSLYTVAAHRPRRTAVAAAAVLQIGVVLAAARFVPAGEGNVLASLIFLTGLAAAAFFIGTTVQTRRAYLGALVDRTTALERERDQQARLAATAERARIARELHDVVAHSLTVVVTMAEAAAIVGETDPAASRAAMVQVATTGRDALAEMRRLLGVLRTDVPDDGEADHAGRAPAPGLDRIEELIATVRAAGLPVRLTVTGPARRLPSALDATAYRVVQESFTNVLKHAADPTRVQLLLQWSAGDLVVQVSDDGRARPGGTPTGGQGLSGMRERLALFEGSLTTGPGVSGGWTVRATLPTAGAAG